MGDVFIPNHRLSSDDVDDASIPGIVGASHYLFGVKKSSARDRFFEALRTGEGLRAGDPVLALRNRFLIDKTKTELALIRETAYVQFDLMIRAWNATRQGRSLSRADSSHHRVRDGKKLPDRLPEII